MPIFEKSVDAQTARQLRQIADMNLAVDFSQFDAAGNVVARGRCRALEYREEIRELWLDPPTKDGQPLIVAVGQSVVLSFDLKGALFNCETVVVDRQFYKPDRGPAFPAVVVRSPTELKSGNRRRHFRVQPLTSSMPRTQWRPILADKSLQKRIPWVTTHIHDISCRGVSFWIAKPIAEKIKAGLMLEISLALPGDAQSLVLAAKVRRLLPIKDDPDRIHIGMEFEIEIDDPDAGVPQLAQYIANCQREIARNRRENR
jgi:c-di-GMP-binding flagellar brake protein YcgR